MKYRVIPILQVLDNRMRPLHSDTLKENLSGPEVCNHCTSGMCCITEDPIELDSNDIQRLAQYLGLNLKDFLTMYTSDVYASDVLSDLREATIRRKNGKIITHLVRKTEHVGSECVFLGWRINDRGHLARSCQVHKARPKMCRKCTLDDCSDLQKSSWEVSTSVSAVLEAVEANVAIESAKHSYVKPSKFYEIEGPDFGIAYTDYLKGVAHEAKENLASSCAPVSYLPVAEKKIEVAEVYKRMERWKEGTVKALEQKLQTNNKAEGHWLTKRQVFTPATYPYAFANRLTIVDDLFTVPLKQAKISPSIGKVEQALVRACNFYLRLVNWRIATWKAQDRTGVNQNELYMMYEFLLMFHSGSSSKNLFKKLGLWKQWCEGRKLIEGLISKALWKLTSFNNVYKALPGLMLMMYTKQLGIQEVGKAQDFVEVWRNRMSNVRSQLRTPFDFSVAYDQCLYARKFYELTPDFGTPWGRFEHYIGLLEKTSITNRNLVDYYNLVTHIGYGMHDYGLNYSYVGFRHMIPKLNELAWKTYDYMMVNKNGNDDPEMLGEFLDGTHYLFGYDDTPKTKKILALLLKTQHRSGGWMVGKTPRWDDKERDVPPCQDDYMYAIEHGTMVGIDALRAYLNNRNLPF